MSDFEATPAKRKEVPLLVGIMAPSGAGKTYSALRLATGMQEVYGGDIYGIDTENNRMLHYADQFKFHHVPFRAPFGSLRYLEAVRFCIGRGAKIIIVDSMTHEHVGEGGYLETVEQIIDRIVGPKGGYKERERSKFAGFAGAAPSRTKMIEGLKQESGAFIFCYRAKESVKPVRGKDGKMEAVEMGFMPIAGDQWVYEMMLNCMLEPRSNGVPSWRSDYIGERLMMKCPIQFQHIFANSAPLSEDIGRQMAEWARGGIPPVVPPRETAGSGVTSPDPAALQLLIETGDAKAREGMVMLGIWWTELTPAQQKALGTARRDAWKLAAEAAMQTAEFPGDAP